MAPHYKSFIAFVLHYLKDDKSNLSRYTGTPMARSTPKTLGTGHSESNVVILEIEKEKWTG